MSNDVTPTLYDWAGGAPAFERLFAVFYGHVLNDPLLRPLFESMPPDHPHHVALWLGEVFGGPKAYTDELGGYHRMVGKHFNLGLREEQRVRWMHLLAASADEAGLPADPEFRSAFIAYIEWGTRLALANSQPGAEPPPYAPVPRWGWGETPPIIRADDPVHAPPVARADQPGTADAPGFARDIRPLFRDSDARAMSWAFDLHAYAGVKQHAEAIHAQLAAGTMPCDGPWPAEHVALFRRWIDDGLEP
jgi:truncated hemoglobin YjbI